MEELKIFFENRGVLTEEIEVQLSRYFLSFIREDHLMDLDLPQLYRVLTRHLDGVGRVHPSILDFLYRCLDHFGRSGSVLFNAIDANKNPREEEMLNTLFTRYVDVFDVSYFDSSHYLYLAHRVRDLERDIEVLTEYLDNRS